MIRSLADLTVVTEYPPAPVYGCEKPEISEGAASHVGSVYSNGYLNDFGIAGSNAASACHDLTFSYVRFTGYAGTGYGGPTTTGMKITGPDQNDIHDITFDHCIFATCSGASAQANAFHAICSYGRIYNIAFENCWFEPYSRIGVEVNGRGGWWHDFSFDHCTFEGGLGEILSFDMFPTVDGSGSVYGVTIDGIVRGVEGLSVTNCLLEGNGAPEVSGYTMPLSGSPGSWRMGMEFGCVYPYASDNTVGRSTFSNNKVGRCYSAWYQTNYSGASYMTFENNVFDDSYNPHGCTVRAGTAISGVSASHCTFTGNDYILGNHSTVFVGGYSGTANTYSGERWTKSGTISASFPFTNSSYEDCHFTAGNLATITESSTRDVDCIGYTGGTLV